MKKQIVFAALILMSLTGRVYAQGIYYGQPNGSANSWWAEKMTKTQRTFGVITNRLSIRDYVYLPYGKMIIELDKSSDLAYVHHLDSLLALFVKDVAFYRDSLASNNGSVAIDYVVDPGHDYRELRFKKYDADGSAFVRKNNDVSKLKIEDDTVRLLLHIKEPITAKHVRVVGMDGKVVLNTQQYLQKTIRVTFCLDNYYDVSKAIADSATLRHVVDTLAEAAQHIRSWGYTIGYAPGQSRDPRYYKWRYRQVKVVADEKDLAKSGDVIEVNGGVGVGLVKNTLSPMGDIGIEINKRWSGSPYNNYSFLRLSSTPYFFFDNGTPGKTFVQDNWFVNLEAGNENREKKTRVSFGVGYLYSVKGNYFQKETFKGFVNIRMAGFTLSPEFIFNDNFKQIYPGLTVKLCTF
jgi:hypothetical protein